MSFIQNIFTNYCVVLHSVQLLSSIKNTCPTSKLLFLNVMMFPIKFKPMLQEKYEIIPTNNIS
jgi:hypothetical protein